MSHSRKHLTQKIVNEYPIPKEQQKIVKVIELRGSNVCEVQEPDGTKFLVSFPAKFRKLIWIKRGDYLIVEPFPEKISRGKIKAQVAHVLLPEHIAFLKKQDIWPHQFNDAQNKREKDEKQINFISVTPQSNSKTNDDNEEDEEDDERLPEFVNPNHIGVQESDSDRESQSDRETSEKSEDDCNNSNDSSV